MQFRIEQRFAVAPATVAAGYTDPGFAERMAGLPRLGRPQLVERREDGTTVTTDIRYAFTADLSPAVRRVVDPAQLTWIEEAVTDLGTLRTTFRIKPDHYAK